jgi:thioredoxin reductase
MANEIYDVAIVGGGPAGLSAALLLGRCRRRVVVIDHGHPRNYAAKAVHGYLGHDGITPGDLRSQGVRECRAYGVSFVDAEVTAGGFEKENPRSVFRLVLNNTDHLRARKLLLATGVVDLLPRIPGFEKFYGATIHHCPYCDGWEHRDQCLVAMGHSDGAAALAVTLLAWSPIVVCCFDGAPITAATKQRLEKSGIVICPEKIVELVGNGEILREIHFATGDSIACDALFFSGQQQQRSKLPAIFGCDCDDDGLLITRKKQRSSIKGLFLAGDADGEVQFAIVAAAEGAIAATAIHSELQGEDHAC